jgi:hypothetical protein
MVTCMTMSAKEQLDADTIPHGVFGHYVENIHFPSGPPGEYQFYVVRSFEPDPSEDTWSL